MCVCVCVSLCVCLALVDLLQTSQHENYRIHNSEERLSPSWPLVLCLQQVVYPDILKDVHVYRETWRYLNVSESSHSSKLSPQPTIRKFSRIWACNFL